MSSVPFSSGKPPEIADSLTGAIGRTIEPAIEPGLRLEDRGRADRRGILARDHHCHGGNR
jgi:hypothetical protein